VSLVDRPKALGFGRKPHSWNVPAPPTTAPDEKLIMWQAGRILNLPMDDFARILGASPSTMKSWCASTGSSRSKMGLGYLPTGIPLAIAKAVVAAGERRLDLSETVRKAFEAEGPLMALYVILHTRFGPQVAVEPYDPHPDPYHRARVRREATTSKRARPA